MKKFYINVAAVIGIACCIACQKAKTPAPAKTPDVYVSGFEFTSHNSITAVAEYWKNGAVTKLTDGTNHAQANAIAVSGSNVYVAGFEMLNNISVAKYWKNGAVVSLTNGTHNAVANSITIAGNDIYVCGHEEDASGIPIAKYWKNGVATVFPLDAQSSGADATSIIVNGNDVYVSGTVYNTIAEFSAARYWKNGTAIDLPANHVFAKAGGIYVAGGSVYATGYEGAAYDLIPNIAEFWQDGKLNKLSDGINDSKTYAITGNQTGIYLAGYSSVPNNAIGLYATYWVNYTEHHFNDGKNTAEAYSIAVSGNDVYAAGYETPNDYPFTPLPRCWKNDKQLDLTASTNSRNGRATGIVIVN